MSMASRIVARVGVGFDVVEVPTPLTADLLDAWHGARARFSDPWLPEHDAVELTGAPTVRCGAGGCARVTCARLRFWSRPWNGGVDDPGAGPWAWRFARGARPDGPDVGWVVEAGSGRSAWDAVDVLPTRREALALAADLSGWREPETLPLLVEDA